MLWYCSKSVANTTILVCVNLGYNNLVRTTICILWKISTECPGSWAFFFLRENQYSLWDIGARYIRYDMLRCKFEPLFRRRLSAEVAKPESNKRWNSGSGHVCLYVCFSRVSHDTLEGYLTHLENPKWCHVVAPWIVRCIGKILSGCGFLTSARHVKIEKNAFLKGLTPP